MAQRIVEDRARGVLAMALVGYALDVPLAAIVDADRSTAAALARSLAMYLAHVAFGMSLGRVGRTFGRDRATVAHACRSIEDRRDDPRFDRWLDALERTVAAAPAPYRRDAA
ncbi:MAG TPA: helix-turn-helix domain-containing protein [Hyphomonadaceae bacterium]|nr:helix-turn-helix domain-containing protein [Hyphomonadaceae bacterium]